ncbi:MAG: hypothetical protein ACE5ID_02455, partial [Acidobacteriota bacterium]
MKTRFVPGYAPDAVERIGRRLKMEYVGMASVFAVIFFLFRQAGAPAAATLGLFFLFLGLKKKTRDHLSASFLMFVSTLAARGPVAQAEWAGPFILAGLGLAVAEGFLEKRPVRIYLLPPLFWLWGMLEVSWVAGWLLVAVYLLHPWSENPKVAPRLAGLLSLSAALGLLGALWPVETLVAWWPRPRPGWIPLSRPEGISLSLLAAPTLLLLLLHWRRLNIPHRMIVLLTGLAAPLDLRFAALFALEAPVLLSASLFRQSVDSARLRPLFKHAEWYFFWLVLG